MPIVAVPQEPCVSNDTSKATGDRLNRPGASTPGDWSHEVPECLQLFDEGLSGEPSRLTLHHVVVEHSVFEPKEKTLDDLRDSSEERVNRSSCYCREVPEAKHNQTNQQTQCFCTYCQRSGLKLASLRKLPSSSSAKTWRCCGGGSQSSK